MMSHYRFITHLNHPFSITMAKSIKKVVPKGWVIHQRANIILKTRKMFKPSAKTRTFTPNYDKYPSAKTNLAALIGGTRVFADKDPMSSVARTAWLNQFVSVHANKAKDKFIKGNNEHKCDFGDQSVEYLLDAIMEEVIDQLFYIAELKRRLIK